MGIIDTGKYSKLSKYGRMFTIHEFHDEMKAALKLVKKCNFWISQEAYSDFIFIYIVDYRSDELKPGLAASYSSCLQTVYYYFENIALLDELGTEI